MYFSTHKYFILCKYKNFATTSINNNIKIHERNIYYSIEKIHMRHKHRKIEYICCRLHSFVDV